MEYLVVTDNKVYKTNHILEAELTACKDGDLQVINAHTMKQYHPDGSWQPIPVFTSMLRMDNLLGT